MLYSYFLLLFIPSPETVYITSQFVLFSSIIYNDIKLYYNTFYERITTMEIERKFLLRKPVENLRKYKSIHIEQAYICTNPVIRIRSKRAIQSAEEKYVLTVKSSGMLARQEFELPLDRNAYYNLQNKAEGNVISKTRYLIPLTDIDSCGDSSLTLELDIFDGLFDGLCMGEIEFADEESAKKYNPPEDLFREVTYDTNFHNSTMSAMSHEDIKKLLTSYN